MQTNRHAEIERETERIMRAEGVDRKTAYRRAVEELADRLRGGDDPTASMVIKAFPSGGPLLGGK